MYLKNIKLAGFKSFVDVTNVPVQNRINAIVGPNGCGKSNIVDALRWVIGESSAKQLRGQSMSDVIFNGTTDRKPVGKAFVELDFDNSDRRLVGEYAQFGEISLRREITREGQSNYYINSTHCRRRDIIDIFLGTGLGPNSYAIIEQGMISKLIEAKPDELRVYIEEAAGISKYRERRRETENRMRHTNENLERLNDIREELEKQLRHLKRQANAAERYQEFKREENLLQLQIKALHWKALNEELAKHNERLNQQNLVYEELLSKQREIETEIEKNRAQQVEYSDASQEIQKKYYSLAAEVARIEQNIKHTQDQVQSWQTELKKIEELSQELTDNTTDQENQIIQLVNEIDQLRPAADEIKIKVNTSAQELATAQAKVNQWQEEWDAFQTRLSSVSQRTEVAKTKIEHFEQQFQQMQQRITGLQQHNDTTPTDELNADIHLLSKQVDELSDQQHEIGQKLDEVSTQIPHLRQRNQEFNQSVNSSRQELQLLEARYASLETLQQSDLGIKNKENVEWLVSQHLDHKPRLGQMIRVQNGWELAVETILRNYFDAICVEDIDSLIQQLEPSQSTQLMLIENKHSHEGSAQFDKAVSLASQVESDWPLTHWLSGVYIADDLVQACQLRKSLSPHESVITKDGIWLGVNWVRISKVSNSESSILLREKELKELDQSMESKHQQLQDREESLKQNQAQLNDLESLREEQQKIYQAINQQLNEVKMQLLSKQSRLEELLRHQERINQELSDCCRQSDVIKDSITQIRIEYDEAMQEKDVLAQAKEELQNARDICRNDFETAQDKARLDRQKADEIEVQLIKNENQLALLKQTVAHATQQLRQLTERRELLLKNVADADEPLRQLSNELQTLLSNRSVLEQDMRAAERVLENHQLHLKELESVRHKHNTQCNELQSQIQSLRMECQAIEVRQTTIQEQVAESNSELNVVINELPAEAEVGEWNQRVEQVAHRINRLGPINLAAIDEYKNVNERKEYLDKQHADLVEALTVLEDAIRKIDKETRAKFKDTYDRVNSEFQTLFPRVFGGGKAGLELTDEDLLLAGVIVRAQPPGKRNVSIHMLSGGEKALTAIALVFSLFQLNPAPFCVLDEVDAPLDDLNVGRFCQLVTEMAKTVQFIVISHNKITIEMADNLMGITMQEAGVSRVVAVDIKEAMEMAGA